MSEPEKKGEEAKQSLIQQAKAWGGKTLLPLLDFPPTPAYHSVHPL